LESALQLEEGASEVTVEEAGEAALIIDPQTRILYCNRIFAQMIHQPGLDLIGSQLGKLLPSRDRDRLSKLLARARKSRTGADFTLLTPARKLRVHLSINVLPGDGLLAYGVLATPESPAHDLSSARDLAKRRFLEREILAINRREELRIGRDLHDQLAQSLAGIAFLVKVLEQKLRAQGMEESQDARRVGELVREAVRRARRLAEGLCPVDFAPDGLNTALGELCNSLESHLNVPCRFKFSGQLPRRTDTATNQLYLITRELVTSAVAEGGATWVTVRLENSEKESLLTLEHNGNKGRESDRRAVDIARYRASVIGARLRFARKEGGINVTRCTVPLA
jgi:signal transduction histidine kinase